MAFISVHFCGCLCNFSVDFSQTDHAKVAAAYGIKSWRVENPAELRSVLAEAAKHDGPALVEVISDVSLF